MLAYGPMVKTALDAAAAAAEDGRNLEVIDLRTLSPLDLGPVYESVRKTGRCVVVHEAPGNLGLGAEIAARITEECFYSLEAPVLRVTGFDMPVPGRARRGGVPARPGPGAGRRRPLVRLVTPMSRIKEFNLPDLGEGLTEGEILDWLVKVGDTIELNQPIVEVETAKAAVEIPAKWAGVVTQIFHEAGTTVEVGAPIIAIDTDPGAGTCREPSAASRSRRSRSRRRRARSSPA